MRVSCPRPRRTAGPRPGSRRARPAWPLPAVDRLRLSGAIFLRGEYTESWAYDSMPLEDIAGLLVPDASRVILFHVVASGRCWVRAGDGELLWAEEGDVIVLPYGDNHQMGGTDDAVLVSATTLVQRPPWTSMPVIRHGEGGAATQILCGYLTSEDPLFDPRLRALPTAFVVRPPEGAARSFVSASVEYAVQQTSQVGRRPVRDPTECSAECMRTRCSRRRWPRTATRDESDCELQNPPWPAGSATSRRRRSAAPSSGPTAWLRASGAAVPPDNCHGQVVTCVCGPQAGSAATLRHDNPPARAPGRRQRSRSPPSACAG